MPFRRFDKSQERDKNNKLPIWTDGPLFRPVVVREGDGDFESWNLADLPTLYDFGILDVFGYETVGLQNRKC